MKYRKKIRNSLLEIAKRVYLDVKRWCRFFLILLRHPLSIFKGPYFKKRTLIIEVEYGGLGDTLFYSHLPRLAKESGRYDAVYLSNVSPFRKKRHKEIIWGANPYLDGYCSWFGETYRTMMQKNKNLHIDAVSEKANILDEIMLAYRLDDGKRLHNPELYYSPKKISELEGKVVFDPNFVTPLYDTSIVYNELRTYFLENHINIDLQFKPTDASGEIVDPSQYIIDSSFEEFCNIIYSCKELYCFASGTAVLAAAMGRKANVFYVESMDPKFLFSKEHNYIKI